MHRSTINQRPQPSKFYFWNNLPTTDFIIWGKVLGTQKMIKGPFLDSYQDLAFLRDRIHAFSEHPSNVGVVGGFVLSDLCSRPHLQLQTKAVLSPSNTSPINSLGCGRCNATCIYIYWNQLKYYSYYNSLLTSTSSNTHTKLSVYMP